MRKPTIITIHKLFSRSITSQPLIKSQYLTHSPAIASSTAWFIKVVCTICIHYSPSFSLFHSQFFRINLNPFIAYNVIFHITTRLRQPSLAFDFFCYSRVNLNLVHSENTFFLLFKSLCEKGCLDSAKLVYECMKDDGFLPNIDFLVSCFCDAGEFSIAGEVLVAEIESCNEREENVSSEVYNKFLSLLIKGNRVEEAVSFFKDHVLRLRGLYCRPDVVTYTTVISGYCKLGKMDDATALFDDMMRCGVRPNICTFNAIIDGFGKKGDLDLALVVYGKMISGGLDPDVVTFTSLIDGHRRVGEVNQCLKFWDQMKDRKVPPNKFTFSVMIKALCRENRLNKARDILKQLIRTTDIIPPPFVYNPVIDGFCKSGNVDEANVIVAEMEARGCTHDKMTFTILILGHCMKGRMVEAIGIYNKMLLLGCEPDFITTGSLISCLRKAGMPHEAYEIEKTAPNALHMGLSHPEKVTRFSKGQLQAYRATYKDGMMEHETKAYAVHKS